MMYFPELGRRASTEECIMSGQEVMLVTFERGRSRLGNDCVRVRNGYQGLGNLIVKGRNGRVR